MSQQIPSNDSFDLEREDVPLTGQYVPSQRFHHIRSLYNRIIIPNVGISLVIVSQAFNSIMLVSTKLLETDPNFKEPINPFQILFVRSVITYVFCFIYMYFRKTPGFPLGPKELRIFCTLRGIAGFVGVSGVYFTLQYLAVSDAVAITFLVPMVTGIAAWIFLHERYLPVEALSALISLSGVLLIARPSFLFGTDEIDDESGAETADPKLRLIAIGVGLFAVCGSSSVFILLRKIGKAAHPLISVSYHAMACGTISLLVILAVPSLKFTIPRNFYQVFLFLAICVSGFLKQYTITAGIQREKAGRAALMNYTSMIFALFWDFVVWHHTPEILSWVGFSVIIGSAIMVIYFKPKESIPNRGNADDEENKDDDISLTDFRVDSDDEEDSVPRQ